MRVGVGVGVEVEGEKGERGNVLARNECSLNAIAVPQRAIALISIKSAGAHGKPYRLF